MANNKKVKVKKPRPECLPPVSSYLSFVDVDETKEKTRSQDKIEPSPLEIISDTTQEDQPEEDEVESSHSSQTSTGSSSSNFDTSSACSSDTDSTCSQVSQQNLTRSERLSLPPIPQQNSFRKSSRLSNMSENETLNLIDSKVGMPLHLDTNTEFQTSHPETLRDSLEGF